MGMTPVDPAETDRSHAAAHDARARGKDLRTGRPVGDHGTANDAIDFALDFAVCDQPVEFLKDWREGAAYEEWPEFYTWLAAREAR